MAIERRSGNWQATYRGPDRKERTKTFRRKVDAENWIKAQQGDILRGSWVDPAGGRITLKDHVERWIEVQPWKPQTTLAVRSRFEHHVFPLLGTTTLAALRPSDLQAWVAGRSQELAPGTVAIVVQNLRSALRAAVTDRLIAHSPADALRLPSVVAGEVVPLLPEELGRLAGALPERYQMAAWLVAGSGLRQGELFGLTVDRVDFLHRSLRVDRQLVTDPHGLAAWAPPKNAQSNRTIPLADSTLTALSAHLAAFPAVDGLIFSTADGHPVSRNRAGKVWRAASVASKVRADQRSGWHDLRHFYASVLIRAGISVKEVSARLGHKDATTTLRTYAHLWPNDDDRTRQAVEAVVAGAPAPGRGAVRA